MKTGLEKWTDGDRTELGKEAETREENFWRNRPNLASGFRGDFLHYLLMDCDEACSSLDLLYQREKWCLLSSNLQETDHPSLSMIKDSGFEMIPASSLGTCGHSLSGRMGLCTSSLFKCSLTWYSSTKGSSSLLHTFPGNVSQEYGIPKGWSYL